MVETKGNNQEKKCMSRHHLDVATPKGYEGCCDTTLRSRPGFVYEATREVFAKEKRLQLVLILSSISCRDIKITVLKVQPKTVSKEVATCSQIEALAKELSLQPFKKSMSRNDVVTNHSSRDLKKS